MASEADLSNSERKRSATHAVTLADVGKLAGVSPQTASRAIRKPEQVSPGTLIRVKNAVAKSGYVPNLAARNLASNKSRLVAALVPSISTSVFSETIETAVATFAPAGYQLILGFTNYSEEREEELVRQLLGRRPDSVLLIGTAHTEATLKMLSKANIPVVEAWGWTENPIDSLVGFSDTQATSELVRDLHKRNYRRFVYAGSTAEGDHRAQDRIRGYLAAHRDLFGDSITPGFIDTAKFPLTLQSGANLYRLIREKFPDADVALFATDILANGALLAALGEGTQVPEDIAIAGFGDFELSSMITPGLTTVGIPAEEIGRQTAVHLLDRMSGKEANSARFDVGYTLIQRAST